MNRPTRRQLMWTGGLAAALALAGCSTDDSGDDDDGGAGESDRQVAVQHTRLIEEKPTGYREYTEVPDGSYDAEELVWIYYEPVGLTTEEAGEGEVRIRTNLGLTVTDPDGDSTAFDEGIDREIQAESADEQYFFWNFQPESPAKSGEYTAEITVTDELADEQASETVSFTIEDGIVEPDTPLAIEHVRQIEEAPSGYREYTEQQRPYRPNEAVWIYYEPVGVPGKRVDDETISVDLALTLTVTGPDGNVYDLEDDIEQEVPESEQFQFWNFQPPQPTPTGEYSAEIGVTDEYTGEQATAETAFTIEELQYRDVLEEVLVDSTEIDIDVTSVTEQGRTVTLVYESAHGIETDEAGGEIAYISGVYAGLIDEGWGVEELVGRVTDGTGTQHRFTVSSELARQYFAGEIEGEELYNAVMETLERVES